MYNGVIGITCIWKKNYARSKYYCNYSCYSNNYANVKLQDVSDTKSKLVCVMIY